MRILSVLFTLALIVAANRLAEHLKRANALPANIAQPGYDIQSTGTVSTAGFKFR